MLTMLMYILLNLFFISQCQAISYSKISLNDPRYTWMDEQIADNFSYIPHITAQELEECWNHVKRDQDNFTRYQIINSKVYGPRGALYDLMNILTKIYPIPDVDFIYYYGDDCSSYFCKNNTVVPILGSTADYQDRASRSIMFADRLYDILSETTGWNQIISSTNAAYISAPSWEQKIAKAWWRGVPSDGAWGAGGPYKVNEWHKAPRGKAVYLSHYVAPHDIDAAFIPFGQVADIVDNYQKFIKIVPMAAPLPRTHAMGYKYHLNLDGQTATFPGYQWRLLTGGVTFKQDSFKMMWFYGGLKPWVHYIPFERYCGDLIQKIAWAKQHDATAKTIGTNARIFALNNIMPEHVLLYCYKVLLTYASLQKFTPRPYNTEQRPRPSPYTVGNQKWKTWDDDM